MVLPKPNLKQHYYLSVKFGYFNLPMATFSFKRSIKITLLIGLIIVDGDLHDWLKL